MARAVTAKLLLELIGRPTVEFAGRTNSWTTGLRDKLLFIDHSVSLSVNN